MVPLRNAKGETEVLALAVPFLRPSDVPAVPNASDPYPDGIKELYRLGVEAAESLKDKDFPGAALIALGHCHLAGGDESTESERRLIIGGCEALQANAFPKSLAYVALGHLHKPQAFEDNRIRYSGSPIPLSFSEQNYVHQVLLVTFDAGERKSVESFLIPKVALLKRIPEQGAATLQEVLKQLGALPEDSSKPTEERPFIEVHILNDGPDLHRRSRIEEVLSKKSVRLAAIKLVSPERKEGSDVDSAASFATGQDLQAIHPETIFQQAYREKYQAEPDAALLKALNEILLSTSTGL